MNVLVVEDHPTDMKLLATVLRTGGHEVIPRETGEQALQEIRAKAPDVILLDLRLPGMDGLALARLLKDDPQTRHIPIVAITAATGTFDREKALAAGCDAFIVKPVDTRALNGQVTGAVAGRAQPPGGGPP